MISARNLSSELHEAALTARMPDERLLWEGRPSPARVAQRSQVVYYFTVPWIACWVFWMMGGMSIGNEPLSLNRILLGLLPVAIGIGLCYTPFDEAKTAQRTAYAITDKRILKLVLDRKGGIKVEAYLPTAAEKFEFVALSNGSGDIIYNKRRVTDGEGSTKIESSTLVGIPNVREVERLLWATFMM